MKKRPIHKCPVCGDAVVVTRYKCLHCDTEISGAFPLSELSYLSPEHIEFIKVFIKRRGNISEVEKELGISYPTVRNMLNNAIRALGYEVKEDGDEEARIKVLEDLDAGNISTEDALRLLRKTK